MATRFRTVSITARHLTMAVAVLFLTTPAPAFAANQPWRIVQLPSNAPAIGCANVIAQTARDAVRRCLAKVGVQPIPLADFLVTGGLVCKSTHLAISVTTPTLRGYVYSKGLSPLLRPLCPP